MSMPVRPFTVALASATVRVAFLTISEAPSFERTVRLSMLRHRLGRRADDLGQHREDGLDDRRLVELAVRLGAQGEGLRLGLALGEDDAGLGVALEGRLLGGRLGVDLGDPRLRLALRDLDGGLGLAGELDPLGLGLGRGDPRQLVALGAPDLGLGLGLGRAGSLLAMSSFCLRSASSWASSVCLRDDLLRSPRPGRAGPACAAFASAAAVWASTSAWRSETSRWALSLICWDSASRTAASWSAVGLGHPGVALAAGRLLLADEVHVADLVADRLDREVVDRQAGRGEVGLARALWTSCWNFWRS